MSRAPRWSAVWPAASMVAIFAAVLLLARASALTFPYPWNDEARFFLPSFELARTGSLRPLLLHAPGGIFWTPHGFYVYLAVVLRVFGGSMEVARTANQVLVAMAAAVLIAAHARLARSWTFGAVAGLLLVSPPVILAANEVRMESVLCLLYALALLLVTRGWYVGALALLLLSVLVHPAMLFGLGALCVVLVAQWIQGGGEAHAARGGDAPAPRATYAEWALLLAVLVAVWLEARFVLAHWALFRAHMGYQSGRKLHHGFRASLLKPQGLLLVLECVVAVWAVVLWLRGDRAERGRLGEVVAAAAIALGLQVYAVLGAEFQYDVYSLAVTPATFFCVARRLVAAGAENPARALRQVGGAAKDNPEAGLKKAAEPAPAMLRQ